ncbi:MAG: EamA family transporter, partial [Alphaproteobacteria bacterium]
LYAGEALDSLRAAGVALVSLGIGSLALGRARGGARPVLYALATGAAIAAYTVVDALGVRQSGSALGYIGWIFIANAAPTVLVLPFAWRLVPGPSSGRLVLGGLMVFGSYGLVIWALSLGAMASVAALRETSVLIAAAIGSVLLGEPFGPRRIAASAFVALGLVLLNLRA